VIGWQKTGYFDYDPQLKKRAIMTYALCEIAGYSAEQMLADPEV
jgi:hypothetical protein